MHKELTQMSLEGAKRTEYTAISMLCIVLAALMASPLLRTPNTSERYLLLATPYVFLLSIWWAFRSVYTKNAISKGEKDGEQITIKSLRSVIQIQTIFGSVGIAAALAMGFVLGRLGSH
jgi:hypothetical protein